jgi:hypothetical protein
LRRRGRFRFEAWDDRRPACDERHFSWVLAVTGGVGAFHGKTPFCERKWCPAERALWIESVGQKAGVFHGKRPLALAGAVRRVTERPEN